MKTNMGHIDRIVRLITAIAFSLLYISTPVHGIWTLIMLFIGGLLIGSAAIGYCPIYALMGVDTCNRKKD